jgi:Transmembrane secretion effector
MDGSGIIGPLISALFLPLAGVSFIFGLNGLGFLLMFLAVLQWKRVRVQSNLPLENFFESLTTAIRYVRYTPGIKILLARHTLFSFFISIIPSLMPVVGLEELHLEASNLGFLFTSMAVGSVISGAFIIPWARARYSPQRITTFANLVLILDCFLAETYSTVGRSLPLAWLNVWEKYGERLGGDWGEEGFAMGVLLQLLSDSKLNATESPKLFATEKKSRDIIVLLFE